MKPRTGLLVFGILLAAAGTASAQLRQGTVELNPYAGYLFGGRFDRSSTPEFDQRLEVNDHATYGGRLGYNFTSLFEMELQYSRTDTAFVTSRGDRFDQSGQRLGDLQIDYYMGYATVNFGHGRVVPYFTIGAGAARLDSDVPTRFANADTRFTAGLGGGAKIFFTPHFGLRFDGRGYSTYLGRDGHSSCGNHDSCGDQHWLTNAETTGGLLIAF